MSRPNLNSLPELEKTATEISKSLGGTKRDGKLILLVVAAVSAMLGGGANAYISAPQDIAKLSERVKALEESTAKTAENTLRVGCWVGALSPAECSGRPFQAKEKPPTP